MNNLGGQKLSADHLIVVFCYALLGQPRPHRYGLSELILTLISVFYTMSQWNLGDLYVGSNCGSPRSYNFCDF